MERTDTIQMMVRIVEYKGQWDAFIITVYYQAKKGNSTTGRDQSAWTNPSIIPMEPFKWLNRQLSGKSKFTLRFIRL